MRPDAETTEAFIYCLGFAAGETGVKVVFFLAMSNHYHAGVIDTHGRLPEFLQCFHLLFAKHQNVLRGRWENFWAAEQTSVVELVGDQDGFDKMVYTLTNPVKDHLVARASEWPGASSLTAQLNGQPIRARRPARYFSPNGRMPHEVILQLAPLPSAEPRPAPAMLDLLRERIQSVEREAAGRRRREHHEVLGIDGILKQRWSARPTTFEPRRGLSPRVACRNVWRRIEAIRRNKLFVAAYQEARALDAKGIDVLFPAGTYWRARFGGRRCEDPPKES